MRRSIATACAVLSAVVAGWVTPASSTASAGGPTIYGTQVVHAPIGKKGGLMTPYVGCADYSTEPRVRTSIIGLTNSFRAVYAYRGSMPGYAFPRVPVGRYEVRTVASCGTQDAGRIETVRVRQKTAGRTISRAEFRRIKRGMSRQRVKAIVGYDGAGVRDGGRMWRTYEMMPFWRISIVEFRHGRVVRKSWNVDHD